MIKNKSGSEQARFYFLVMSITSLKSVSGS